MNYNSSLLKPQQSHSTNNLMSASRVQQSSKQNPYRNSHLGLNPNIPIQDQYVQNLLKQVHFMNMQIKLLKQKQSQSNNNTLWGIVNRTNQPLVKNIIVSQQKYQQMKGGMDHQKQTLINQNVKLADEQNAILKQYQYLEEKTKIVKAKRNTFQGGYQDRQLKNKQRIADYSERLKIIQLEKENQKKKNQAYFNQLEQITTESQKEQSKTSYELKKIKNDQVIQEIMQKEKIQQIQQIKRKIQILKQRFQSNEDYQKAQQEQNALRQRISNLEKGISGANFTLMQLAQSIKMAQDEKQKEIRQRKKLTEEYQSVKTMLMEILLMNMGRQHKQSDNRKRESNEIQKAEYQTKKLEKSLEQIKKKLSKSQDTQNQLHIQVQGLQRDLEKLKTRRDQLRSQLQSITTKNQQQQKILSAYNIQLRKYQDCHIKTSNEQLLLTGELTSIEEQIQYLRGRKDFLNETLNLKDTLNETKLEDLQRVVQKNIDLNQTVGMLMGKWEEIKTFSRI